MENVEQFSDDCQRDVRIMKRFTDMMSKDRLPLFFEHYDRVPEIVKALNLDLEFDEEGKIIYREKSQLFHITYRRLRPYQWPCSGLPQTASRGSACRRHRQEAVYGSLRY